jgi:hypothetical protein
VGDEPGAAGKTPPLLVALHCTALHCTALHCTALHCSTRSPHAVPRPTPHAVLSAAPQQWTARTKASPAAGQCQWDHHSSHCNPLGHHVHALTPQWWQRQEPCLRRPPVRRRHLSPAIPVAHGGCQADQFPGEFFDHRHATAAGGLGSWGLCARLAVSAVSECERRACIATGAAGPNRFAGCRSLFAVHASRGSTHAHAQVGLRGDVAGVGGLLGCHDRGRGTGPGNLTILGRARGEGEG